MTKVYAVNADGMPVLSLDIPIPEKSLYFPSRAHWNAATLYGWNIIGIRPRYLAGPALIRGRQYMVLSREVAPENEFDYCLHLPADESVEYWIARLASEEASGD